LKTYDEYQKTIIVDFDDTLCIYENNDKDCCKGRPNTELISKLNDLHSKGYTIEVFTSRGYFSASSRKHAREKYLKKMEDFLKDLKYDLISFEKPLGIVYIDDKAIRPDELNRLEELK
jgi:hydroxymethylpyrimidine pyrophosphatase-like HAD family hydrolase